MKIKVYKEEAVKQRELEDRYFMCFMLSCLIFRLIIYWLIVFKEIEPFPELGIVLNIILSEIGSVILFFFISCLISEEREGVYYKGYPILHRITDFFTITFTCPLFISLFINVFEIIISLTYNEKEGI